MNNFKINVVTSAGPEGGGIVTFSSLRLIPSRSSTWKVSMAHRSLHTCFESFFVVVHLLGGGMLGGGFRLSYLYLKGNEDGALTALTLFLPSEDTMRSQPSEAQKRAFPKT